MKNRLLVLFCFLACLGCFSNSKIEILPKYSQFFSPYINLVGDTIYFENEKGILDSFSIEKIDSFHHPESFMNVESKGIDLNINHLKNVNCLNCQVKNKNSTSQTLLTVIEFPYTSLETSADIIFNFKNFFIRLDSTHKIKESDLLTSLGINKYWQFYEEHHFDENDSIWIESIIWTKELGFSAYYLNDGSLYKIKLKERQLRKIDEKIQKKENQIEANYSKVRNRLIGSFLLCLIILFIIRLWLKK